MQAVAQGIDLLGLKTILHDHYKDSVKELINIVGKQTSQELLKVFKNVSYTLSNGGDEIETEKRSREEDIVYNFTNFVESLDVEDLCVETIAIDSDSDEDEGAANKKVVEKNLTKRISLIDCIQFCSGSKYILESMKEKGTVTFMYPDNASRGKRIVVSTCALVISFPVTARYYGSSEAFNEHFCDNIVSSPGFGKF